MNPLAWQTCLREALLRHSYPLKLTLFKIYFILQLFKPSAFDKLIHTLSHKGIPYSFVSNASNTLLTLCLSNSCMLIPFSHLQLFVPLWTVACQFPLSVEFSR